MTSGTTSGTVTGVGARRRSGTRKPSAKTRRVAAGCAVFTTVVLGAVALVWSSCAVPDAPAHVRVGARGN